VSDPIAHTSFAAILGQSDETRLCRSAEEIRMMALAMFEQAQCQIDIFTQDFEPHIYNHPEIHDALEAFVLRNTRHSRIRVLICQPWEIAHASHQIITLGKSLSSYFFFRCPTETAPRLNENFLIVDGIATIHRPFLDSYTAYAHFANGVLARQLSVQFTELWELAEENPNFRYLAL